MRVVKPHTPTDATVTLNLPEPDATLGEVEWVAGPYVVDDEVILSSTHRRYRCVTNTSDNPAVGAAKDVPTWVDIGPTNAWAMFDNVNGTKSLHPTLIDITYTPNLLTTAVAGFNISANSILVTMTDPTDGLVYSNTLDMIDNSDIVDYWEYFFLPIINKTEFVLLDLPSYILATVDVTITGTDVSAGTVVFGPQITLGVALYGTSLKLFDASIKTRDEFGNFKIVPRRTSKVVEYDVHADKSKVGYVFNQLSQLTTVPSVYVGTDETDDSTLVFGYYEDCQINIDSPTICSMTIRVQGLT